MIWANHLFMGKFLAVMIKLATALEEPQMEMKDQVFELIKALKHDQAIELIESLESPEEVAELYSNVMKETYWIDKNGSSVVFFGKAGVVYSLKKNMKAWAKTLAYDVAANTWPGWGDEGVIISPEEMEEGLNMAKLNLILTLELNKPKDKVALAHWLIGAHLMAKVEFGLAIGAFEISQEISFEITDNQTVFVNDGYIGICKILRDDEDGSFQFQNAIKSLEDLGTEDSKFYVNQLKTARAIFER